MPVSQPTDRPTNRQANKHKHIASFALHFYQNINVCKWIPFDVVMNKRISSPLNSRYTLASLKIPNPQILWNVNENNSTIQLYLKLQLYFLHRTIEPILTFNYFLYSFDFQSILFEIWFPGKKKCPSEFVKMRTMFKTKVIELLECNLRFRSNQSLARSCKYFEFQKNVCFQMCWFPFVCTIKIKYIENARWLVSGVKFGHLTSKMKSFVELCVRFT